MLSLNAVECIVIWREQMLYAYNQTTPWKNSHSPVIAFMWDDENYLLKMKTDTDFLKGHKLSQWFNFSEKNDPFLVIPSCAHSGVGLKGLKKVRKKQAKNQPISSPDNKYEVPLDNSLMQRIKASEVVLEKESKGNLSESNMSPQTNKSMHSLNKSNHKIRQIDDKENIKTESENKHPNKEVTREEPKRESLFDLRKKKDTNSTKSVVSDTTPKKVQEKVQPPVPEAQPTPIKEVEMEDDETFDYELVPLGIHEKDAVKYLENYIKKLDQHLAVSYASPADIYQKCVVGNLSKWYGLRNKGSKSHDDGLLIYTLDSHFDRINILHLTSVNRKGLDDAI